MLILNIVSLGCHDFLKYIQTVGHKFDVLDCEISILMLLFVNLLSKKGNY